MKSKAKLYIIFASILLCATMEANAQCGNLQIQKDWQIQYTSPTQGMTAKPDQTGAPYLYVAAKEAGVKIYNISGVAPVEVKTISVTALGNLEPMSLTQSGNYIYIALGNYFNNNQLSGMAIIDITDKQNISLVSVWKYTKTGGAGIIQVEGNYAYLGAMGNGLLILDISNKSSISLVSAFIPNIYYPNPNNPDKAKYNARGMVVKNDIVYLCYDAGGVRIINCVDKTNPVETGKYSNSLLINKPRAYNNLFVYNNLLYVTTDYCGLEILEISDTSKIKQVGWWNPWNCVGGSNNWFNSPGYTNEMEMDTACKMIFMSTGRGQLHAINVSNPMQPDSCASYGTSADKAGTWGIGMYGHDIYLTYIFVPLGIPFYSNWSGVKKFTWTSDCKKLSIGGSIKSHHIQAFPNPTNGEVYIEGIENFGSLIPIKLYNGLGQLVDQGLYNTQQRSIKFNQPPGVYILNILNSNIKILIQ